MITLKAKHKEQQSHQKLSYIAQNQAGQVTGYSSTCPFCNLQKTFHDQGNTYLQSIYTTYLSQSIMNGCVIILNRRHHQLLFRFTLTQRLFLRHKNTKPLRFKRPTRTDLIYFKVLSPHPHKTLCHWHLLQKSMNQRTAHLI